MTPRENLFAVFKHKMPEWTPIIGHVDPYNQPHRDGIDPELAAKLGTVKWCDESTYHFSRWLGLDVFDFLSSPVDITRPNVKREKKQEGDDVIEIWHTPAGDLRQITRRAREDGTSYVVEHIVKTADDIPALAALFADEKYSLPPDRVAEVSRRRKLVGDSGISWCSMAGTPMGMMYRVYSGVETLAYLFADAHDALMDLFKVMEKAYTEQIKLACQTEIDSIVPMDDTSTTTISPAMFEECNIDLTNRWADVVHKAGKLYFHHSCGLIKDLLPLYVRTKMDAVHAFTVPPTGNVTVAEGRAVLGNKISIFAGFKSIAEVTWNPELIKADAETMFRESAPGDNYVLGMAAFPHRTMDQTKFATECCREARRKWHKG